MTKPEPRHRVVVVEDADVLAKIDTAADETGLTRSAIYRMAVREWLRRRRTDG